MKTYEEFRANLTEEVKQEAQKIYDKFHGEYENDLPLYCGPGSRELNEIIANYDGKYKERFMGAEERKQS